MAVCGPHQSLPQRTLCTAHRLTGRTGRQRGSIRMVWAIMRSSGNGTSANGFTANGVTRHGDDVVGTVEMYVASDEEIEGLSGGGPVTLSRSKSVQVPPPRYTAPQNLADSEETGLAVQKGDSGEAKNLRAELGVASAELKSTSSQLESSQLALRAKEGEVALLRAAVAERDIRLRDAKSELITTQAELREKDKELQGSLAQLLAAAKERGRIRQQLADTQEELMSTRTELQAWNMQGGNTRGDSMEGAHALQNMKGATDTNGSHVAKLLAELSKLSRKVVDDAEADEEYFDDDDL